MGLFNFMRNQFIDIVQWDEETPGVLVHRFQRHDNEIKNGAKLVVRPGQKAIFVNEGQIADTFEPGTYVLTTKNLPILTTILSLPTGFESWHKAEVYFIKTTEQLDRHWGTQQPIMMRDAEFGRMRIRAFGNYSYRVGLTKDMLGRLVGARSEFTGDEVEAQFGTQIISEFADSLGELAIPALDLASNYKEIAERIRQNLQTSFANLGFELMSFTVANISLPDTVNESIDEHSGLAALGADVMGLYAMKQQADSMRDAARNPGGAGPMMGMMIGGQFGGMMGQSMMQNQQAMMQNQQAMMPPPPPPAAPTYFLAVNGQRQGPFDMGTLQTMVNNGTLTTATLAWTAGMANWQAAGTIQGLQGLFAMMPPPPPPMP